MRSTIIIQLLLAASPVAAQTTIYSYPGGVSGDAFGTSVADVGDVTGDGVPDYLIGGPGIDSLISTGAVYLYDGATGLSVRTHAGALGTAGYGASLDGGEDVDGDGVPDYVIGSTFAPGPPGTAGFGWAFVFSGATGAQLFALTGGTVLSRFGDSVALGDVNGDGTPDIVVGAPFDSLDYGTIFVFSGVNGAPLIQVTGTPGEYLGDSLDFCGDLDGDGAGEIVVAGNGISGSAPRVIDGATGATAYNLATTAPLEVVSIADVDGDGVRDFAGTSSQITLNWLDFYSGSDGSLIRSIAGSYVWRPFGSSIASCDDLDADGVGDVVVGSVGFSENGTWKGSISTVSGATGEFIFTVHGQVAAARLGAAVSGIGDLNGDGVGDLLAGAPFTGGIGAAHVLSGIPAAGGIADHAILGRGCGPTGPWPTLRVEGLPTPGASTTTYITLAPVASAGVLVLDLAWPVRTGLGAGCTTHLDLARFNLWGVLPVVTDAFGAATIPYDLPNDPALIGFPITMQAVFGGTDFTNSHFSRIGL